MDQKAKLEARVWTRVMGQEKAWEKRENLSDKGEIADLLSSEYADLCVYRCLKKRLPSRRELDVLIDLTICNIKFLKTVYYVEKACCYCEKSCHNVNVCNPCEALRLLHEKAVCHGEKYSALGENWAPVCRNKKKQQKVLFCLLQSLL